MEFLARFQGRTNFVTKEGISSVISEPSSPIKKKQSFNADESPKPQRKIKIKNATPQPEARGTSLSPLKLNHSQRFVSRSPVPELLLERQASLGNPSPMLQLQLHTDPHFFEKEKSVRQSPNSYYMTPQHRLQGYDNIDTDNHSFSTRVAELGRNPRVFRTGGSQSQIFNSIPDQQGQIHKYTPDSSINVRFRERFHSPQFHFTPKDGHYEEPQENRLARMNFIERQEKVIFKYKAK